MDFISENVVFILSTILAVSLFGGVAYTAQKLGADTQSTLSTSTAPITTPINPMPTQTSQDQNAVSGVTVAKTGPTPTSSTKTPASTKAVTQITTPRSDDDARDDD